MSIDNTLERIATALEQIAGNAGKPITHYVQSTTDTVATNGEPVSTPAAAKRGPGRPPKAAAALTTPSASTAPDAAAAFTTSSPLATAPVVSKQELGARFLDLIKAGRRQNVADILQAYGAKDLSTMDKKHYVAAHADATAALSA